MRIGVVASSQGGALKAFMKLVKEKENNVSIVLATDRACGAETVGKDMGATCLQVYGSDNQQTSVRIRDFFKQEDVDYVYLFYTRLVTEELFSHFTVYNFHPSLLPAFPGFGASKAAIKTGVKYFGTTIHKVDSTQDAGPIVGQAIVPILPSDTADDLERFSFIQKVYFMLLTHEAHKKNKIAPGFPTEFAPGFNPSLTETYWLKKIEELDEENKVGLFQRIRTGR